MRTLIQIYRFLEGKKRRLAFIAMAIAPVLPEKYQQIAYSVGIVFGGADLAKLGADKFRAKNGKQGG